jgi:hypothetical protein
MKKIKHSVMALGLMLALVGFGPMAVAQDEQFPAPEAGTEQMDQDQSVIGELSSVDHDNQTLMVTTAEGLELEFSYDDQTEFIGFEDTVEGLSTNAGSQIEVFYREEAGQNLATRIQVHMSEDLNVGEQPEANPNPGDEPQYEPAPAPSYEQPDPNTDEEPLPGPEGAE